MSHDMVILRELGATTRTFLNPRAALIWYRNEVARRLRMCAVLEVGSIPRSVESRNSTNATYAKIAGCLKGIEHLAWLLSWYESTWGDGSFLAQQAGLSRWVFTKRCRKTERELRDRLENAGLMEDS